MYAKNILLALLCGPKPTYSLIRAKSSQRQTKTSFFSQNEDEDQPRMPPLFFQAYNENEFPTPRWVNQKLTLRPQTSREKPFEEPNGIWEQLTAELHVVEEALSMDARFSALRVTMDATAHPGIFGPSNTLHPNWALVSLSAWIREPGRFVASNSMDPLRWWAFLAAAVEQDCLCAAALEGIVPLPSIPHDPVSTDLAGRVAWRKFWSFGTLESSMSVVLYGSLDDASSAALQRFWWNAALTSLQRCYIRSQDTELSAAYESLSPPEKTLAYGLYRLARMLAAANVQTGWRFERAGQFENLLVQLGSSPSWLYNLARFLISHISRFAPLRAEVTGIILHASREESKILNHRCGLLRRILFWCVSPRRLIEIWRCLASEEPPSILRGISEQDLNRLVQKDVRSLRRALKWHG